MELSEELLGYRDTMIPFAQSRVGNRELAEDIVQISMMRALAALPRFRGECALKSWLMTIVRNTCSNYARTQRIMVDIDGVEIAAEEEVDTLDRDDDKIRLRKEIEMLPERQRLAVYMRVYEDKSFKEIAAALNTKYNTAKANYRHGMLSIKRRMRNEQ